MIAPASPTRGRLEGAIDNASEAEALLLLDTLPAGSWSATFGAADQGERGNRLRASTWRAHLDALNGVEVRELYGWRRDRTLLPTAVDPGVAHTGREDLAVSHLGVVLHKPPG